MKQRNCKRNKLDAVAQKKMFTKKQKSWKKQNKERIRVNCVKRKNDNIQQNVKCHPYELREREREGERDKEREREREREIKRERERQDVKTPNNKMPKIDQKEVQKQKKFTGDSDSRETV